MNEYPEERTPSGHDPDDERGGGGEGGLRGAAPGADEEATPEGEDSINEPEGSTPPSAPTGQES